MTGDRPFSETVVALGPSGNVVGILADAAGPARRPPLLLLNAGVIHRVGPHRLHVRLARALADDGVPSLRLDLSGIGDSRGLPDGLRFRDSAVADIRAALDQVAPAGPALLFGICSGADNAIAAALADPRVAGIVLVDPHAYATRRARLRHVLRRLAAGGNPLQAMRARLRPRAAAPESERQPPPREEFRAQLQALVARGVRILSIHTLAQRVRNNHANQVFESFPELRGKLDTLYFPRANHTFTELSEQAALIEAVRAWLARRFSAA